LTTRVITLFIQFCGATIGPMFDLLQAITGALDQLTQGCNRFPIARKGTSAKVI